MSFDLRIDLETDTFFKTGYSFATHPSFHISPNQKNKKTLR